MSSLQTPFISSNMLDPTDTALDHLANAISIIHASSVFHLFDYDGQVAMGLKCVKLLKKTPGSMILGRQAGALIAHEADSPRGDGKLYRHNAQSWKQMWQEVIGPQTGTKWRVEVNMAAETPGWLTERRIGGYGRVKFVCTLE